jgi:hypothetical protein
MSSLFTLSVYRIGHLKYNINNSGQDEWCYMSASVTCFMDTAILKIYMIDLRIPPYPFYLFYTKHVEIEY